MVFDATEQDINRNLFSREDWSAAAYGECIEELPGSKPGSHGDIATRRSRTGFIIFLNNSPIYWFSKHQTSVETSSFGSEFVSMKLCCEYIRGLRYKLKNDGDLCY